MIAVLSWGVAGFLTAKLYYVDSNLATPAAAPVAGSPFALQYNTETSWSSGSHGIYFDTTYAKVRAKRVHFLLHDRDYCSNARACAC